MRKKIKWMLVIGSIVCLSLASCNNSSTTPVEGRKEIVYSREDNRYRLAIGETNQITANAYGTKTNKISFKSSNETILTVDNKGLVTGIAEGSAYITIQSLDDESLYEMVDYTVSKNLLDTFPAVKEMVDTIKGYNYTKGMHFDADVNVNVGDVSVYGLLGGETKTTIIDTDQDGKGISLPFSIDVMEEKEDEYFVHGNTVIKDVVDDVIENNSILKAISQYGGTFGIDLEGTIYSTISQIFDEDYSDYLFTEDYDDLYSIDIYNFGNSEYYTSLNRDYSSSNTLDLHPFAFEKGSVIEKMSPYGDDILNRMISSIFPGEENESTSDSLKIEIGGVTIDLAKFLTPDGELYLAELLSNYVLTEDENGVTTYTMDENLLSLVNTLYKEKVTSTGTYRFTVNDFDMAIELPYEITNVSLSIDNSDSSFNGASLVIKGLDKSEEEYTALTLTMKEPETYKDYALENSLKQTLSDVKENAQKYVEACSDFRSIDSVSASILSFNINYEEKTNVKEIIKDANEIYNAQKEYGSSSDNEGLLEAKNKILLYYYSEVLSSEERKYLLYPAMQRLSDMDFANDDYTGVTVASSYVKDNEDGTSTSGKIAFNHFVNSENVNDFTLSYTSNDEEIIQVDNNGYFTSEKGGVYNGSVGEGNVKGSDNSATISVTATPTENSTLDTAVTKQQAITYQGNKKHFKNTTTTMKEVEGYDAETRELTLSSGSTYELKNLFNFPASATVAYTSNDTDLATFGLLNMLTGKVTVKSPYKEGDYTRNLVGISVNVVSASVIEKVVVYIRVTD